MDVHVRAGSGMQVVSTKESHQPTGDALDLRLAEELGAIQFDQQLHVEMKFLLGGAFRSAGANLDFVAVIVKAVDDFVVHAGTERVHDMTGDLDSFGVVDHASIRQQIRAAFVDVNSNGLIQNVFHDLPDGSFAGTASN